MHFGSVRKTPPLRLSFNPGKSLILRGVGYKLIPLEKLIFFVRWIAVGPRAPS
jgi:hypothetical protein